MSTLPKVTAGAYAADRDCRRGLPSPGPGSSRVGSGSPRAWSCRLETPEARGRPQRVGVVIRLERRCLRRKRDPADLRSREDVYIRCDVTGIVESAAANEAHPLTAVLAEDSDLTVRAAKDSLHTAIVARHVDWLRRSLKHYDAVRLDEQVDHERAASLALAVEAVAAMNKH